MKQRTRGNLLVVMTGVLLVFGFVFTVAFTQPVPSIGVADRPTLSTDFSNNVVPAQPNQDQITSAVYNGYTVQAGNTFWGIARSNGCTVRQLRLANSQLANQLMAGQVLNIPPCLD